MDYTKLSLSDFYDIYDSQSPHVSSTKRHGALYSRRVQNVFERLKDDPNAVIPFPLLDLYISSIYEGPRDQIYQPEQILNLTQDGVEQFAPFFYLDIVRDDLETNRRRILRILRYLNLLDLRYEILLQPTILELLAEFLTEDRHGRRYLRVLDLNNFRLAVDKESLDIKCRVECNRKVIGEVPCLTDTSYELIEMVNRYWEHQAVSELIKTNNYTAVQWLLERGSNPNGSISMGSNLEIAAQEGHLDIVKLLLEYKADPNTPYQQQALQWAVENDYLEIMELLLKAGARVNIRCSFTEFNRIDKGGPLLISARNGFTPGVKLLLEYNANLYERSDRALSAVNYAAKGGFVELTRYLVELTTGLCTEDVDDLNLLQIAMYDHSPSFRDLLEQYGAQPISEFSDEHPEEECIIEIID